MNLASVLKCFRLTSWRNASLASALLFSLSGTSAQAGTLFEVPTNIHSYWNGISDVRGGTIDTNLETTFWVDPDGNAIKTFDVRFNYGGCGVQYPILPNMNVVIGNGIMWPNTGLAIAGGSNLYLIDDSASGRYANVYPVGYEGRMAGHNPTVYVRDGSINQSTGKFQINHFSLHIGDSTGTDKKGVFNLEAGTVQIMNTADTVGNATGNTPAKSYNIYVGSNDYSAATPGVGEFNIAGGNVIIPTASETYGGGKLILGNLDGSGNAFSRGTVNLTGGTITAPEVQIVNGTFSRTAGTVKTPLITVEKNGILKLDADFNVDASDSAAELVINDGQVQFASGGTTLSVGNTSTGKMTIQNTGTAAAPMVMNGTIRLGRNSGSVGTLNITDSYVNHTGQYLILSNSGEAHMTLTNSTLKIGKEFYLGDSKTASSKSFVTLNSGSTLTVGGTTSLADKNSTSATVTVNSGAAFQPKTLKIGYSNHWSDSSNQQYGGSAILNVEGGSVTATSTYIGKTSQLNVNSGSFASSGTNAVYGTSAITVGGKTDAATLSLTGDFNAYENSVVNVKSNGTFTSANVVTFNGSSSMNVSGGTVKTTGDQMDLVFAGTSKLDVQDSASKLDLHFRLKIADQATGTISAGTHTLGNDLVVGYTNSAANAGTAALNLTGGTLNVGQTFVVGVHANSVGEVKIGGGTGTALISALSVKIGEKCTAASVVELLPNGTLTCNNSGGNFTIGHEANSKGEVILNGGTITSSSSNGIYVGYSGSGTLTKADAGTTTIAPTLRIGANGGSTGTLNVLNGTLKTTGSYILTGIYGNANINAIGGNLVTNQIYLGDAAAAITANVVVSQNAEGRTGSITTGELWVADKNKTTGNVDVREGGTLTTNRLRVGFSQHFIDANASHVGGKGTLLVSGGTFLAKTTTQIGEQGTLKVTDGSFTGTGDLTLVGAVKGSNLGHGTVLLDGTDAVMTLNGNVNLSGNCEMNLNAGTFIANAADKTVTVGAAFSTGNTKELLPGESRLTIDGATATIGTLNVGAADSAHTGNVTLKSGTLNLGTLNVVDGKGTFTILGGTLNVGTSSSKIVQEAGALSPGGDGAVGTSVLVSDYSMIGGAIHFDAGAVDELSLNWNPSEANDLITTGAGTSAFELSGTIEMDLTDELFASIALGDQIVIAKASSITVGDGGLSVIGDLPGASYFWRYGITNLGGADYLYAALSVPEPSTWALLLLGILAGSGFVRKRGGLLSACRCQR